MNVDCPIIPPVLFPFLIFFIFLATGCNAPGDQAYFTDSPYPKHRGVHDFSIPDSSRLAYLHTNNINWVTLVAWGYQDSCESAKVMHHNGDSVYINQSDSGYISRIKYIREAGFKVFLKPHVWIYTPQEGQWRADIFPSSEENWEVWKKTYRDFILRYAQIAEDAQADMFCVGTEFSRLSVSMPEYWSTLIDEVRNIYAGELTYAANWHKEYQEISFWNKLDYVGVQAYFPLTKNESPSLTELEEGWNNHLPALQKVHKEFQKPILFTEMGYKSTTDAAISPWEWLPYTKEHTHISSYQTQANCYQSFFNQFWDKDWFAGVHIWYYQDNFNPGSKGFKLDFIPAGKPAEQVITENFAQ